MKKALLVFGPESSGTRMLTECFVKAGYSGSYDHHQPFDDYGFSPYTKKKEFVDKPDKFILRRSFPHNKHKPDVLKIIDDLVGYGYEEINVLIIIRNVWFTIQSQLRNRHVKSKEESGRNIAESICEFIDILNDIGVRFMAVDYQKFVKFDGYREEVFNFVGEDFPEDMTIVNGNEKYENGEVEER